MISYNERSEPDFFFGWHIYLVVPIFICLACPRFRLVVNVLSTAVSRILKELTKIVDPNSDLIHMVVRSTLPFGKKITPGRYQ